MKQKFILTVFSFLFTALVFAGTSRALLIGINIYKPAGDTVKNSTRTMWRNLNGCVNDANAMKEIILTKYGFLQPHIISLHNADASRQRIMAELQNLVTVSKKGDIVFIFYAGHGSQMVNTLSVEKDNKDETIVPADAYKGVADIRDKELNKYFNQLLANGILLTVIFDSCHSGSIGRGMLYPVTGVRYIDENPIDARDSSNPPRPEDNGALIISAAQDFEFAKEVKDENNLSHGAFTLALLKALQQNAADAPVEDIFTSLKAIMRFFGKSQEPVLAGITERKNGTLFGMPKSSIKKSWAVAVSRVKGNEIELMGGYALGLSVGVKLKSVKSNDTLVIIEMVGANRSLAKLTKIKKVTIAPGALFQVAGWASSVAPALKIYIPQKAISTAGLSNAVKVFTNYRSTNASNWVADISKSKAAAIYHFNDDAWWFTGNLGQKKSIGATITEQAIQTNTTDATFVNLPPDNNLLTALRKQFADYDNIALVADPAESLYGLVGTLDEKNMLRYAFVKTNALPADSSDYLPMRTDFETYDLNKNNNEAVAERLAENIFRAAKIKDWLSLQPPAGDNKFPFRLQVQHYGSKLAPANGKVKAGDTLSFFFTKSKTDQGWNRKKRYVYVFSLDATGAMKLLFPNISQGNVENRFPLTDNLNQAAEKSHLADILVRPPYGNDTFFMLTTEEAIGNLSAFQQPGVMSRGPNRIGKNPLEAVLFTGTKSRNRVSTPLTWSLHRISLRSEAKIK